MKDSYQSNESAVDRIPKVRLLSLDAFRGILIIHMIMGNSPGNINFVYPMLAHTAWNGWSIADLVPAGFLWLMGVCMPFVLTRRMEHAGKRRSILVYIIRRSLIIFIIGFVLNVVEGYGYPEMWSTVKYLGVLQRIGASYLFAALLFVVFGFRGHAIWIFVGPLIYWFLLLFVPVPGFGSGNLGPVGNTATYLDFVLLGQHGGNPHSLLSLLTSTATISFGVFTGYLLKIDSSGRRKILWLLLVGVILIMLGEVAGQWLPINRRLWTPSFVLFSAGILNVSFCLLYGVIDIFNFKKWIIPLVVFGLNPLFIFYSTSLGNLLAHKKGIFMADGHWMSLWDYAYGVAFLKIADPINASLLFSVMCVLISFIAAYVMYRKDWVVKI